MERILVVAGVMKKDGKIMAYQRPEGKQLAGKWEFPGGKLEEGESPEAALEREKRRQQAVLAIKKKFGKNAILKGASLEDGATAIQRNGQIGGHKA